MTDGLPDPERGTCPPFSSPCPRRFVRGFYVPPCESCARPTPYGDEWAMEPPAVFGDAGWTCPAQILCT